MNGVAVCGDFLGAATMLGSVGLIMLFGFDGAFYSLGWLVGFVTVLFFAGERLRNAGRYTIADALTLRLQEKPTRCAVAVTTLLISLLLMVTQLHPVAERRFARLNVRADTGLGAERAVVG